MKMEGTLKKIYNETIELESQKEKQLDQELERQDRLHLESLNSKLDLAQVKKTVGDTFKGELELLKQPICSLTGQMRENQTLLDDDYSRFSHLEMIVDKKKEWMKSLLVKKGALQQEEITKRNLISEINVEVFLETDQNSSVILQRIVERYDHYRNGVTTVSIFSALFGGLLLFYFVTAIL